MSIRELFIEVPGDDGSRFVLNRSVVPPFSDDQERAKYLVEAIRFWGKSGVLFHITTKRGDVDLPEDEWQFSYKSKGSCDMCANARRLLDAVFWHHAEFEIFPCVTYPGDRERLFSFGLLKQIAEYGTDCVAQMLEVLRASIPIGAV